MAGLAVAGTTMVIVTHELGFAHEIADRLVVMEAGKVVEQGPAAQRSRRVGGRGGVHRRAGTITRRLCAPLSSGTPAGGTGAGRAFDRVGHGRPDPVAIRDADAPPELHGRAEARRARGANVHGAAAKTPGTARARENISAPWYNDWDRFTQQQIQNTLLRRIKPQEALTASANKARELKKQS